MEEDEKEMVDEMKKRQWARLSDGYEDEEVLCPYLNHKLTFCCISKRVYGSFLSPPCPNQINTEVGYNALYELDPRWVRWTREANTTPIGNQAVSVS